MAEEDVDWGMDDFDPWQGAEEQVNGSSTVERLGGESINQDGMFFLVKLLENEFLTPLFPMRHSSHGAGSRVTLKQRWKG